MSSAKRFFGGGIAIDEFHALSQQTCSFRFFKRAGRFSDFGSELGSGRGIRVCVIALHLREQPLPQAASDVK